MTKFLAALAVLLFLLSVPAARASTYYLSPGGNDSNNGSMGSPWLSPNHAVSCGDQIIASASNSYSEFNFYVGKWGPVAGAGHCVAWLTCATFDACKINSTNGSGMIVTASHWGVMGWEVSASPSQAICFEGLPPTSGASIQDVIFADDIANGCYGAAFQPVLNGGSGVDYFVLIADISYNGAQESNACTSGIDIYTPVQTDSEPGTHIYISQTFSWANVDPNPCAGHYVTDGEGIIFDTWDQYGYAAQAAMENNISFFNGSSGYRVVLTTQAPVFIVNNTSYGNNAGPGMNASWCGEIITQSSGNVTAEKNIAMTNQPNGCGSWPVYAYYLADWHGTNTFDDNLGYSASGSNDNSNSPSGFVFGPNNIFGTNPQFTSAPASVPPAPNCAGKSSVIACMAPIILDFTAKSPSAAGLGYQQVSYTSITDSLFPSWLCQYSSMLSGLITMGCGTSPVAPAITSASSAAFNVGVNSSFSVTATGSPAPALSEAGVLPSGVSFTPATGALSGTPASGTGGTYSITFTAQNGVGSNAMQSFTLTVNQATAAPAITSASSAAFTVGTAGTFTVTATGSPVPTLSESGVLPSGVTFTPTTGALSGTPASGTGGTYPITFTAQNGVGSNAMQTFTLTVTQVQSGCTPVTPPSGTYLTDLTFSTFNVSSSLTRTLNAAQSPACTTTAASYIETTGSGQHTANENYIGSIPNGAAITETLYVANVAGSRYLDLAIFDQSWAHYGIIFGINPTTCTTSQSVSTDSGSGHWTLPGTPLALTQVSVNGTAWCQVQLSVIPQSSASGLNIYLSYDISGTGGGGNYAGDGVSGMKFWGEAILTITPPTITSASSAAFTVGVPGTFTVTAAGTPTPVLSESGGLPSGVSFSGATGVLSGTPAAGTAGTYPITFTAQNGVGSNAMQSFTLTINGPAPPTFTSASSATFAIGMPGSFNVTATGTPVPTTISETGALPGGVSFVNSGNGTATISGTPTASGAFPITITAHNGVAPDATQSFTLKVNQAPAITSSYKPIFLFGTLVTFTVTTTGFPVPTTISETGALPGGVSFVNNGNGTATISGTPAADGYFPITVTAHNGVTPDATQSLNLTVEQAPAITSPNNVTFTVGGSGTFTVTASGTPASTFSESGALPPGLTLSTPGVLSGTPASGSAGIYPITITAINNVAPNATQTFTLTVNQAQAGCTPVSPPNGAHLTDLTFSTFNVSSNLTRTLNATQSPACANTAATYIETTGTGQHSANESYTGSIANGVAITQTMYVSNVSGSRYLDLGIFDQSWSHYAAIFGINPATCATSQVVFTDSGSNHWTLPGTPLTLTPVTIGGVAWCQIQLSVIPQSSATGLNIYFNFDTLSNGGGGAYTGDGKSEMKFWGAAI